MAEDLDNTAGEGRDGASGSPAAQGAGAAPDQAGPDPLDAPPAAEGAPELGNVEGPAAGVPEAGAAEGAPSRESGPRRKRYVLQVRYGALAITGCATATKAGIQRGEACIMRTARGTELALALTSSAPVEGDVTETIGHVLREATSRDLEHQRRIEDEVEPEELRFCREKIRERGLSMRLSMVEHLFGSERVVFYFTSERRVDFRALVRDLAWHFHARIELKQIGARDEARLLSDFEHCGRPLCCKTFLRSLEPVTMRLAKLQRTTLDPHKISGRCGRLMCCLRFEEFVYRELRKGLPNRGTRVVVGQREGEVLSSDILTQMVTVRFADNDTARVQAGELRPPERAGQQGIDAIDGDGEPSDGGPDASRPPGPTDRARAQPPERDGRRRPGRRGGRDRAGPSDVTPRSQEEPSPGEPRAPSSTEGPGAQGGAGKRRRSRGRRRSRTRPDGAATGSGPSGVSAPGGVESAGGGPAGAAAPHEPDGGRAEGGNA